MTQIKTTELSGAALDWAVAKCEGEDEENTLDPLTWLYTAKPTGCWDYSTKWSQGGPIIEREKIAVWFSKGDWKSQMRDTSAKMHGDTPLIAAMRCYVASKLGDTIEVSEALK